MSNLMRSGTVGSGVQSGVAGSLRSLSHVNSLRRGPVVQSGGNGATRMTKSRSFANLSGKDD